MIHLIILLLIFLFLSAFFSASETSIFSLSHIKLEDIKKKYPVRGSIIEKFHKKPQNLLIAILIGNLFVNISISLITIELINNRWIAFFTSAILILIFGEITPKTLAIKVAPKSSLIVAPVLRIFSLILFIPIIILSNISKFLVFIFSKIFYRNNRELTHYHTDVVMEVIKESQDHGILEEEEGNILGNIVQFAETDLYKILRPRGEIFSLPIDTPFNKITDLSRDKKYSRIPIWEGNEENIIGILNVKDFIKVKNTKRKLLYFKNLLKKPFFIPDSTKPEQLLKTFQSTHTRLGIVIDEYGGIAGLITLEDVIEQIIGEVMNKNEKTPLYQKFNQSLIEVESKMEIKNFNKIFKSNIKSDSAITLGGYILENIKRIPKEGEKIIIKNLQIEISKALPNKIEKIRISKIK